MFNLIIFPTSSLKIHIHTYTHKHSNKGREVKYDHTTLKLAFLLNSWKALDVKGPQGEANFPFFCCSLRSMIKKNIAFLFQTFLPSHPSPQATFAAQHLAFPSHPQAPSLSSAQLYRSYQTPWRCQLSGQQAGIRWLCKSLTKRKGGDAVKKAYVRLHCKNKCEEWRK